MKISENDITNRLCYLLLGLIIGVVITITSMPRSFSEPSENTIRIELIRDSISATSKDKNVKIAKVDTSTKVKILNESNLKTELDKNNIPHANIVLAQAKLESGNFKSELVHTHQNIFGLKRGNRYRKYSHWTECVKDYKKCISDRYNGGNYYAFLNRIKYSSHPDYTKLLKSMMQKTNE